MVDEGVGGVERIKRTGFKWLGCPKLKGPNPLCPIQPGEKPRS